MTLSSVLRTKDKIGYGLGKVRISGEILLG